ncbi:MAG: hypothetical protein DCF25_06500 [Leptolyngbya foveolarum]|uniref:Uncharacterized protein n=1 Tax=Leptolyngbya foveolarum TaxID=47253 RepID=A0A2W4UGS5_9CYAN|nr:MAG: hypothetical protein DCF25_06500 [Leptolyngbya foveolarum]
MTPTTPRIQNIKPLIAFGLVVSLVGLMLGPHRVEAFISNSFAFSSVDRNKAVQPLRESCETDVVETAKLSREQLLAILSVPERDSKNRIREIVQAPYCQFAPINVRAGVEAQGEAYPLAFDPDVALVILYENDEYAGYRFKY